MRLTIACPDALRDDANRVWAFANTASTASVSHADA